MREEVHKYIIAASLDMQQLTSIVANCKLQNKKAYTCPLLHLNTHTHTHTHTKEGEGGGE